MPIKEDTSSIVVEKQSFLDYCTQNSKKVIITTILVVGAALAATGGIWSVANNYKNDNLLARVGNEGVYLAQYKQLLFARTSTGTPDKPTKLDEFNKLPVLEDLIKLTILEKEATNLNISLSKQEVQEAAKKYFQNYQDNTPSNEKQAYEYAVRIPLLESKIKDRIVSWKEGNFIACRFDRYIQDDYIGKTQEANALLAKQQPYAKEYCTALESRMKSGATFESEFAKIKEDKTIGNESWAPFTMTIAKEFNKENYKQEQMILGTNLFSKINELKGSGSFLVAADSYKESDDKSTNVPGLYAVVTLNGKVNEGQVLDFDTWLLNKYKESNVVKYPERIKL